LRVTLVVQTVVGIGDAVVNGAQSDIVARAVTGVTETGKRAAELLTGSLYVPSTTHVGFAPDAYFARE
jgi:hypothetical protein